MDCLKKKKSASNISTLCLISEAIFYYNVRKHYPNIDWKKQNRMLLVLFYFLIYRKIMHQSYQVNVLFPL